MKLYLDYLPIIWQHMLQYMRSNTMSNEKIKINIYAYLYTQF